MIINRTNITQVVEAVFTAEEKEILEVTIGENENKRVISDVPHQFLFYYEDYCYKYDIERLKADVGLIKATNIDYLYQIKALKDNILYLMNPLKYNKRTVRESVSRGMNDGLSVTKRNSNSDSNRFDVNVTKSDSSQLENTIDQGASSQTNDTGATEEVLKTVSLVDKPESRKQIVSKEDGTWAIEETSLPHNVTATINKAEKVLPFTNTTIGQRIAVLHESGYTDDTTGSKQIDKSNDTSNNINTSEDQRTNAGTMVVGSENENRIKLLQLEIPRLREKFYSCFEELFDNARLR